MNLFPLALLAAAAPIPSEDAKFEAIWREEWQWRIAERLADDDPDAVSARLPDVSAAAHARREAYWTAVMRKLGGVDEAKLSPQARIDFQVYRNQIATLLDDERFREWEKPVNGDSAFWGDLQYPARGSFARGETDYRAYLSQLADQPRYVDQQIANMRLGLARGFTPPAIVMQGRERPVVAIAEASDPAATVYYEPFAKLPATMPEATRAMLRTEARRAIAEGIIPAHRRLLAFLRTPTFPA